MVPYSTVTNVTGARNPSTLGGRSLSRHRSSRPPARSVTSGSISFRQGKLLLGTVALSIAGTATLTTSSLAVGKAGIQAIYGGAVDYFGSCSAVFKQTVGASPTITTLLITTQTLANGRIKFILVATVTADGDPALTPTGTVVFKKNGHSLGRARVKGGVARLVLGRKAPGSGARFAASFQKSTRFRASSSPPLEYLS